MCVYRELKFLLTPLRVTFKNCFKIFLVGFSDFRCKFRGDCYCNTWILLGLLVKNIVWPCPVSNKTILSLFALKISIFFRISFTKRRFAWIRFEKWKSFPFGASRSSCDQIFSWKSLKLPYFGWKTFFLNSFWEMEIVSVRSLQIVLWPKLELKDVKSLAHFGSL